MLSLIQNLYQLRVPFIMKRLVDLVLYLYSLHVAGVKELVCLKYLLRVKLIPVYL